MNLLERYLAALRPLLPRKTGEDILREIADEIQSQMEEHAEAFGRPLTEDEQTDVIRKHGHPVVVAARYGRARYLIGPEIFPFYWRTLKVSLIVTLAIWSVVIAVGLMSSAEPGREWAPVLSRVPGVLITVFGVVTGLFAAAQFSKPCIRLKLEPRWDLHSLPHAGRDYGKRTQSIFESLFGVIALTWWQLVPSRPILALGPAAQFLNLGPAWDVLRWPVLVLIAANICKSLIRILRPERTILHARFALLLHAAELIVLLVAVRAGDWVAVDPALAGVGHFAAAAGALNRILSAGCFLGLIVRTIQFAFKCIRHWRGSAAKSGLSAISAL
jgi:hypothetical protein